MFPSLGRKVNFDDRILLLAQGKWVDPDAFNLGNGGMTEAEERTYFGLCKLLTPTAPWMMDHFSVWRLLDYGTALASVGFIVCSWHRSCRESLSPRAQSFLN